MSAEPPPMPYEAPQSVDTAAFEALQAYDWDHDQEFQIGLRTILSQAQSPVEAASLLLKARCFYFTRKSGVPVSAEAYQQWLVHGSSDPRPPAAIPSESSTRAFRHATGTAQPMRPVDTTAETLTIDDAPSISAPGRTDGEHKVDAPYPTSFQHIVELITTGQPIPGIKEIPNVLNEAPPSESARPVRKKPWEIAAEKVAAEEGELLNEKMAQSAQEA